MTFLSNNLRWFQMVLIVVLAVDPNIVWGQMEGIRGTVHNLSVSGPGELRAVSETEICKFCHVPHNAVIPEPLWGHALSAVSYYRVPLLRGEKQDRVPAPQPDGSSRLCLSCHDGTVALGEIHGRREPIAMVGGERLSPGHRGYLGEDLSGGHPISFVVGDSDYTDVSTEIDMGLMPLASIERDPDVKLDRMGKMQCTTCHDPHSDRFYQPGRTPRFWVKPTYEGVCLTCHVLR